MGAQVVRRVVLDTPVALSALLFPKGHLTWLRQAWQRQQIMPLVCKASANELLRVLAHPKFELSAAEQKELLADYLPHAEIVDLPDNVDREQIFPALARAGSADAWITQDDGAQAMRANFQGQILTADELATRRK